MHNERLLEVLWPDGEPESGLRTIRTYVSRLRSALGDGYRADDVPSVTSSTCNDGGRRRCNRFGDLLQDARQSRPLKALSTARRGTRPLAGPSARRVRYRMVGGPVRPQVRGTAPQRPRRADRRHGSPRMGGGALAEVAGLVGEHPVARAVRRTPDARPAGHGPARRGARGRSRSTAPGSATRPASSRLPNSRRSSASSPLRRPLSDRMCPGLAIVARLHDPRTNRYRRVRCRVPSHAARPRARRRPQNDPARAGELTCLHPTLRSRSTSSWRCSSTPTSCRCTTTGATRAAPTSSSACCAGRSAERSARDARAIRPLDAVSTVVQPDRRARSPPPTAAASPTATSSRPTSCSTRPASRTSPTSASHASTRDSRRVAGWITWSPRYAAAAALMSDAPLDQYLLAATAWELLAGTVTLRTSVRRRDRGGRIARHATAS